MGYINMMISKNNQPTVYTMRNDKHSALRFILENIPRLIEWLGDDFIGVTTCDKTGNEDESTFMLKFVDHRADDYDNFIKSLKLIIRGNKATDSLCYVKYGDWIIYDPEYGWITLSDSDMCKRYKGVLEE